MTICSLFVAAAVAAGNPWTADWQTPYGVPPFAEMKVSEYIDALKIAMKEHRAEVENIVANPDVPTFKNTVHAFAVSGYRLHKMQRAFAVVFSTDRTPEMTEARKQSVSIVAEHSAFVNFNRKLFERIEHVYKKCDKSVLTQEERMLLEKQYLAFVRAGVNLPQDKQARLKEINKRLSELSLRFSANNIADNNAFKKKFGIDISEFYVTMGACKDRGLRESMFKEYTSRGSREGETDNRAIIVDIMNLRAEQAKLLGYKTSAHYFIEPRMAKTPDAVEKFLDPIMKSAVKTARKELAQLQLLMDDDIATGVVPKGAKIEPWDWLYYAERMRKAQKSVSNEEMKKYFKLKNVLNGVFIAANTLYGISVEEVPEVPSYSPGNTVAYKVTDVDGSFLGIVIFDVHPRATKASGAWNSHIRYQMVDDNGNDVRPIVINACNFGDNLTPNQVSTVFHEFGHALQCLLSKCKYRNMSGTNGHMDYVEIFSQFNEHWAVEPYLLKQYAVDETTGRSMPEELIEQTREASKFLAGIYTSMYVASALLDLKIHLLEDFAGFDPEKFEKSVREEISLPDELWPAHGLAHFKHIFVNKYQAGYFSYTWAEVLELNLFAEFEKKGDVWNKELARRFRKTFLETGATRDPMELFRSFTGAEPSADKFFEAKGLLK